LATAVALGVAALVIVSLITFLLTTMLLLYIALLPFCMRSYRGHKAAYEQKNAETVAGLVFRTIVTAGFHHQWVMVAMRPESASGCRPYG